MDTWLEIDLEKLRNNFYYMKKKAKTKIISVVKANAYGMGSVGIAKELEKIGTDMFAVATYEEAEELRESGITTEILILNETDSDNLKNSLGKNYIFSIFNTYFLKKWISELDKNIKQLKFHLKVDTGMNRLGIKLEDTEEISSLVKKKNINIGGIYSHFSAAESDEKFTEDQYQTFIKFKDKFNKNNIEFKYSHLANSAACLKYDRYNLDFVRIGMALYGLQPLEKTDLCIKEIFTWKAKIIEIKDIKKGERVSYSQIPLEKDMKIAIIPVGYAQGYMRQLSNKGYVLYRNQKCKIVGKICMEKIVIDISEIQNSIIEDEVILLGDIININQNSDLSFTIADDIISKIDIKIKRIYK